MCLFLVGYPCPVPWTSELFKDMTMDLGMALLMALLRQLGSCRLTAHPSPALISSSLTQEGRPQVNYWFPSSSRVARTLCVEAIFFTAGHA